MKLHTKLILTLIICLSTVIAIAQFIQYRRVNNEIKTLTKQNLQVLLHHEETFARSLYNSVAGSVADSLNRGEMVKFSNLLKETNEVDGLIEFSLFSKNGKVEYASNSKYLNKMLSPEINTKISNGEKLIFKMNEDNIEIYHPQKIVADCLRCHLDWKLDDPHGGVMYFKFSIDDFLKAKQQTEESMYKLNVTYLTDAAIIVVAGSCWYLLFSCFHDKLSRFQYGEWARCSTRLQKEISPPILKYDLQMKLANFPKTLTASSTNCMT